MLLVALCGCAKNIKNKEAVKKAVMEYLSKRSDLALASMDIDVTAVSFKDKEAEAVVSFKPKGMDANAGMQMVYVMEQKGSEWGNVRAKNAGSAGAHGGGAMPESQPLPPGHPPTSGGTAKQ